VSGPGSSALWAPEPRLPVIRLAVRVRREQAELVLAELLELAPGGGVEEVQDGDEVEYALYGAPGELPELPDLQAAVGAALVHVSSRELADDWAERWKAFHRPVEVAGRLRVRPPWEPALGRDGLMELVIDPGQAFGTGAHHTTRLSLELLSGLEPGGAFVDLGCGSGVLAIAAAVLGWSPVLAVDHDPASLQASAENAAANGVQVEVRRLDLRREPAPWAPTAVANLTGPLLLELAARLQRAPGRLVLSGLLGTEADDVAGVFARHGLRERARRHGGEWAGLLLAGS